MTMSPVTLRSLISPTAPDDADGPLDPVSGCRVPPVLSEPAELTPFHRQMIEMAERSVAFEAATPFTVAASRLNSLWSAWTGRTHLDEAASCANFAFVAVIRSLHLVPPRVQQQWAAVADSWIDQLRQLGERRV